MQLIEDSKKSNVKREVALIMTVGTSIEPLEASLRKEAEENNLNTVIAFYGSALPGQVTSPLEVVTQLKKIANGYGCKFIAKEVPDPNSIDSCLEVIRSSLREQEFDSDEIVFNITGGSKPLTVALAIAAVRLEASAPISFSYVGGKVRDEVGRAVSEGMQHIRFLNTITREKEEEVFTNLKRGDFIRALVIAEQLPDKGRTRFLRRSCKGLYLWDSFQYKQSHEEISQIIESAKILSDGRDGDSYSSLASSVIQLKPILEEINKIISFIKDFSNPKQAKKNVNVFFKKKMQQLKQNEQLQDYYIRLIADCLENARRHIERAPVETVMRTYRAIELAVKLNLLINEINPDNPQWDDIDPVILGQADIYERPVFIMLDMGIKLLKATGLNLSQDFEEAKANI
ncbi:MAG: hypothetical protein IBX64_13660, partial [Actinobacteria bacterium]|nr:hypothetical protein [Actinomycetota bacterium]